MNLTGFALRSQPLVLVIVAALALYSVSVLDDFPSQEDPPITVREAVVTTFVPGMEAEDVELLGPDYAKLGRQAAGSRNWYS